MNKRVLLLHGFNKREKDMFILSKNLKSFGWDTVPVRLPLTFKEVEYASKVFEEIVKEIVTNLKDKERIHMVGHSTGGLIIRHFLYKGKYSKFINRCVLIATPNKGCKLADFAGKLPKVYINIFKTLKSLQRDNIKRLKLYNSKEIQIGGIAGNNNNLFLGRLINEENDGRVEVSSVKDEFLKDFIVLPYGHKEIHYKLETARLIDNFLRTGRFGKEY